MLSANLKAVRSGALGCRKNAESHSQHIQSSVVNNETTYSISTFISIIGISHIFIMAKNALNLTSLYATNCNAEVQLYIQATCSRKSKEQPWISFCFLHKYYVKGQLQWFFTLQQSQRNFQHMFSSALQNLMPGKAVSRHSVFQKMNFKNL